MKHGGKFSKQLCSPTLQTGKRHRIPGCKGQPLWKKFGVYQGGILVRVQVVPWEEKAQEIRNNSTKTKTIFKPAQSQMVYGDLPEFKTLYQGQC